MAYMFVVGNCIRCGKPFSFNHLRVPSVVVKGEREPLCRDCVTWANPLRIPKGLEPIALLPGAYEPEECS